MKRIFDFSVSLLAIVILSPLFVLIALAVAADSRGGIFYIQQRIGKNFKSFGMLKFRTMYPDSDKKLLLTVGNRDSRITRVGYFLRKYKLDEFPQLFNVLTGEMSLVGPRPEVKKYVDLYNEEQRKVLSVKPGITDLASIEYSNENEILSNHPEPEKAYIEEIMPAKLKLNLEYISKQSFLFDVSLLLKTVGKILF